MRVASTVLTFGRIFPGTGGKNRLIWAAVMSQCSVSGGCRFSAKRSVIRHHGKPVLFYSKEELVNVLEQKKSAGEQGQHALRLMYVDLVILDEMVNTPFSQGGGALLLFPLRSKLYELSNAIIIKLSFTEWASVFCTAEMITALPNRPTHQHHHLETGNEAMCSANPTRFTNAGGNAG